MMTSGLPLRRMVLYKHGVGYFTRQGVASGREVDLSFRSNEVDDALKSLTTFTLDGGQVTGVHYRTPENQQERLAEIPLSLGRDHSLFDLLRDLRGVPVSLELRSGRRMQGRVIGLEQHPQGREWSATLVLLTGATSVEQVATDEVVRLELEDERPPRDLDSLLEASRSEEAGRTVRIELSEPGREVQLSYTIPSPVWRVSYRLVGTDETPDGRRDQRSCLLQGWGIFDNRLDEDLEDVEVTLVAGQPVSFRYDLTSSVIPERRFVRDEARIAAGPIEFEAAVEAAPAAPAAAAPGEAMVAPQVGPRQARRYSLARMSAEELEGSTLQSATGGELDELFEYRVGGVSVRRGESAMIPVVQRRSSYRRELLYNGSKHRPHPVVSLRLHNDTGLTLERGPVTVVEDGQYRGEAMLPFTKAGGEIVLAFAVELGVRVLEEQRLENTMAGLELEDIYLQVQEYETKWVTYTLINTTNTEQVITLEQARWRDAELTQTRKPDEETGEHRRWRVDCPPGRQTSFKVGERLLTARRESIVGQDVEALSAYLETRFLDRDSRRKLEAVLRLRRRMGEIDREVEALRTEQQELGSKQERLRKNLTINATNEEEQEIRRRSAEEFRRTQDRDNAIEADLSRLKTEREQAERDLHAELAQF